MFLSFHCPTIPLTTQSFSLFYNDIRQVYNMETVTTEFFLQNYEGLDRFA